MNDSNLKSSSATDWEKIDKLTDEEIDTSDIPPLDADFFARAELRMPQKSTVTLNVDTDVLEWFKAQGGQFQDKMNAALRIYAEAHKQAS
ncbi:MAG: BrnA antitoxin family protein [Armatimonadota bacterium]|nr:BrnA antitoxin family protein [Armatimonadota bacterium]